ncbi:helix-hairpin-helix domain-containing protein [Eisenibacter elegans]|jgi:DNA uptake protein ComE-like DNA-binding protein|uniref:helix-hairpin-helix domain-containing protein n=1 Tax=Eisenibacter elegans TaxID=997 RepID=UPI00041302CF|nr:helix-hairpin-helix domain-containing protein [Eisenibacter elegans]
MLKQLTRYLRDYFGFSRVEIHGMLVLGFFCLLLLAAAAYPWPFPLSHTEEPEALAIRDSLWLVLLANEAAAQEQAADFSPSDSLYAFNPNHLEVSDWQQLGFSEKLALRLYNYVYKGGQFRYRTDLRRIYGFPDEAYALLEPYILLPEKQTQKYAAKDTQYQKTKGHKNNHKKYAKSDERASVAAPQDGDNSASDVSNASQEVRKPFRLELNRATAEDLQQIKGIGPGYSGRIVKYRESLGGFYDLAQLGEVYQLPPEVVAKLQEAAYVDASALRHLYINSATEAELALHPYLSAKQAKTIVAYRKNHGAFSVPEALANVGIFSDAQLTRLLPYIHTD